MGRFWNSRTVRKFRRNKLAIFALVIIGAYVGVGSFIMVGGLSEKLVMSRVAPNHIPGFYFSPLPEKRFDNAVNYIFRDVERQIGRLNKSNDEVAKLQKRLARAKDDAKPRLEKLIASAERSGRSAMTSLEDGFSMGRYRLAKMSVEEYQEIIDEALDIADELDESQDLNEDPDMISKIEELEGVCNRLYEPLSSQDKFFQNAYTFLGTDRQGRSILLRAVYSIKVALQIGIVTALISVVIGSVLGAAAGFYGGWVDFLVIWLYSTLSSIPNLVLLVLVAYLMGSGGRVDDFAQEYMGMGLSDTLFPVYVAFCATFWIGPCRVIRGETMKIKQLEYIQAATTSGFGNFYILIWHIIPNTAHLMFINFSLLLIGAIKSEVILSFLNLGVKKGASWGIMIRDSGSEVLNNNFWQISAATFFMFVLVLAFNILSDALQDIFDPKHL